jgi:NAD(P)-dependent dehydrogenase (short-subunit alcohol dehydrogenase family)
MADKAKEMFNLSGRVALVTGASSGLGRSFAIALARAGARVVVGARRLDRLEETAALIRAEGGQVAVRALDVTSPEEIEAALLFAEATFGVVDLLVNNAGVARSASLIDVSEADWDAVVDTNLKAVHLVAAAMVRRLRDVGGSGSIVNIASILGRRVSAGLGPYIAAKAGVIRLTQAQALEWARYGIRVNAIAPGYFPTEINAGYFETSDGQAMVDRIPMRRVGQLHELTGPLLLLASDASAYMTGAVIHVDGGHLCSSL